MIIKNKLRNIRSGSPLPDRCEAKHVVFKKLDFYIINTKIMCILVGKLNFVVGICVDFLGVPLYFEPKMMHFQAYHGS